MRYDCIPMTVAGILNIAGAPMRMPDV